jgi:hypothetical protein
MFSRLALKTSVKTFIFVLLNLYHFFRTTQMSISLNVLQLKGDVLRCGFSDNWRLTNNNFSKMTTQNIGTG